MSDLQADALEQSGCPSQDQEDDSEVWQAKKKSGPALRDISHMINVVASLPPVFNKALGQTVIVESFELVSGGQNDLEWKYLCGDGDGVVSWAALLRHSLLCILGWLARRLCDNESHD